MGWSETVLLSLLGLLVVVLAVGKARGG